MSVSLFKYLSQPHVYLDNLRNLATIVGSVLIPVTITWASSQREKKRATLDVLRRFSSEPELTSRLWRLYLYRRFEAGEAGAENPFSVDSELIEVSIFLLNLCDTVAIEADAGLIDHAMLSRALGPTLIGARDVVLARLQTRFGMDVGTAYDNFDRLVTRLEADQVRRGTKFVTRIPPWSNSPTPPP